MTQRQMLEPRVQEVIADLTGGMTQADVARKYGASTAAVCKFTKKYAAQLAETRAEVNDAIRQLALVNKQHRIEQREHLFNLIMADVEKNGITITETRIESENGEDVTYVTNNFRGSLVKEARGLLMDIATELGEIPKAGDTNIQVNIGEPLVRYVHFEDSAPVLESGQ